MNKLAVISTMLATTAFAQPGPDRLPAPTDPDCCEPTEKGAAQEPAPTDPDCCEPTEKGAAQEPARLVATAPQPAGYLPSAEHEPQDGGWQRPPGQRFLHGFRLGWTFVFNYEEANRSGDTDGQMESLKSKYDLKTPHMMLIGYEGMYRIIGHSWLNVVMVGNVTVAGLEQSKFIPAASGLIGAEFNESFQLGVGVNVTPDPDAPTHAIFAAGWTPRVGSIHTPVHFFFVPEPSTNGKSGSHRMGATVGVTW